MRILHGGHQRKAHTLPGSKGVLTVEHLNHNRADRRDETLAAMCQRCHLTCDALLHRENAARPRRGRLGQLALVASLGNATAHSGQIGNRSEASSTKKIGELDYRCRAGPPFAAMVL